MDSRIVASPPPDPTPFFDAAFVGEQSNGPLYVTTSDGDALQVVSFTTGGKEVLSRLGLSVPLATIVEGTWQVNRTLARVPLADLREVTWIDGQRELRLHYVEAGRARSAITYLTSNDVRESLLDWIEWRTGKPQRIEREFAGFFTVAGANIVGAMLAASGSVWMYANWDPVRIGRVRNGGLALMLGQNGCALVGAAFFLGCCVVATNRLRRHFWRNRCVMGE
jgi:hypothetical protein